jgi:tetratricopeptide (TPR) repeat protein
MRELRTQIVLFIALILLTGLGVAAILLWWPTGGRTRLPASMPGVADYPAATYIGRSSCIDCHQQEAELWAGSDHDLAMQDANEDTVLGDFDDATFTHFGITTKFYRKDGGFYVNTAGPGGELQDYKIAYTFGITPLQQYLIAFPGGRYQVLGVSWDSRPESLGGQRWYSLYPDESILPDDPLYWTGPNQNWNFMCAECHSTNLQKNYDLATDSYDTRWAEMNVSCESCHGPGSNHVGWAKDAKRGIGNGDPAKGLAFRMESDGGTWQFEPDTNTAQRTRLREDQSMIQMCARCHSRRTVVAGEYRYGQDLLDTHRPELLTEGLYYADGQILDEVYVYGSFLQSRMYRKGVTCTDCHDPHSMKTYAPGNALCATCHLPDKFDTPSHTFHEQGTEAGSCVACHMPTKNYMGVDARLDHSIRVPRPDLSVELGVPNACNKCHEDQSYGWAAQAVAKWYGPDRRNEPHYGEALYAGQTGIPGANEMLAALADNPVQPGIARATAVSLLRDYPTQISYETIQKHVGNSDPMVRYAALSALEMSEPSLRLPVAYGLLEDPVLSVRVEAARVLAPVDTTQLNAAQRRAIKRGIEGYIQSQLANADRAESHMNIALVRTQRGQVDLAEQSYRTAIRINPMFAQAYVNLADLYRATERDDRSIQVLEEAVEAGVKEGVIHYSLGLALVRLGKTPDAIQAFQRAVELSPQDPRFGYTLGIALNSTEEPKRALQVLADTHQRHPTDQSTLYALMTISRDSGELDAALSYANTLLALNPDNPNAIKAFIQQAQRRRGQSGRRADD